MSTYESFPPDASWFVGAGFDELRDNAFACNDAALLVEEARLQELRANNGADRIRQLDVRVVSTRQAKLFDAAARCALSYFDQTVGIYTNAAIAFALTAVTVLTAVVTGQTPEVQPGSDPLPSQVLGAPDTYFPLITIGETSAIRDDVVTDQNAYLRDAHANLMATLAAARQRLPLNVFDDPAALATRPATAVDLNPEVPDALHRFASACTWAAALAAKP